MAPARPVKLKRAVDDRRDHVLGNFDAPITLVEYGSYACGHCQAANKVIATLRNRFGDQMRYVFRHRPASDSKEAERAAELAEYADKMTGQFWTIHDVLMNQKTPFSEGVVERIASDFNLPSHDGGNQPTWQAAADRVKEDVRSAQRSGALEPPTFFINNRRYEGPWDENSLAETMLGSLGHRLHAATVDFVRWGPSAGVSLLLMSIIAILVVNSPVGPTFQSWWDEIFGFQLGGRTFALPLLKWVNDGLLTIFFLVVGLEIKREFTVGRLATRQKAALPIVAAVGGMIVPALIYLGVVPPGPLHAGWGMTIATDTAFAVALIVLLGTRVPVELRVFLTATVIMDDLVIILVIAVFYTGNIDIYYLLASVAIVGVLGMINHWRIYRTFPYVVLGVILWICLHESGIHATLGGVILAMMTPTRHPANLHALLAQAESVIRTETKRAGETLMHHGPSEPALQTLDVIHDRIESPASKLLRSVEPWSTHVVLPVFALANAGVVWSLNVFEGHVHLMLGVVLGLVLGKPLGIFMAAWLAVRFGIAVKPAIYSWRQLAGAGALAGIGFTMSLFIAAQAFADPADYAAAQIAIFLASFMAGIMGVAILWVGKRTEQHVH